MENFKIVLKKRIGWLAALLLLNIVLLVLAISGVLTGLGTVHASDFIEGFQLGALTALAFILVALMIRYTTALKNPTKLKKLYIHETDERTLFIQQKVGGLAFTFFSVVLLFAIIVAGYFNLTVAFTLLAVCVCFSLYRIVLKLYYFRKY
ncbi:hypothetical protein LJC61_00085 [Ruminococcaceae bacterium OttesenSCG-928-A16]|nr:hypothetical protein [Ruminococcaceae bacterium OttesenSCG-928-A16]